MEQPATTVTCEPFDLDAVLLMCYCHNSSVSVRAAWWDSAGIMYTAIGLSYSKQRRFNKFAASEVCFFAAKLHTPCYHIQLNRKWLLVEKKERQRAQSLQAERDLEWCRVRDCILCRAWTTSRILIKLMHLYCTDCSCCKSLQMHK